MGVEEATPQHPQFLNHVSTAYNEISFRSPLAALPQLTPEDLKNPPLYCVPSQSSRKQREYGQNIVGFQGKFFYGENLEDTRLLVIGGGIHTFRLQQTIKCIHKYGKWRINEAVASTYGKALCSMEFVTLSNGVKMPMLDHGVY